MPQPIQYKVIGHKRGGGQEVIYEGPDWSNVSDMMPNQGEPDKKYSKAELYENGQLVESNETSAPGPSLLRRLIGW